eukprot:XP_011680034.1 PREDICTED: 2,3-bisphosphoglycerate-independent phosphoglycerate mutase [Strongylocentrotus purpuratus]
MSNVCLVVIDGWGITDDPRGNAILNAKTPVMDELQTSHQFISLDASGHAVGLPEGLMGNSEVGHLTIGAGRAMYQSIVKIDLAIKERTLFVQKAYLNACQRAKAGNGRMHLLGLVSDGGVHSHINHLFALLGGMKEACVPQTFVHFFGDGRDTSPTSAVKYLKQTQDYLAELQYGSLATVMGRYYAMDRDKRDERIKVAFEGLVQGIGEATTKENVIQLVQSRYDKEGSERQTDEFLTPIIVDKEGCIRDGDTLMFIDFRADRMRQIVEAIAIERKFETSVVPKNISVTCMTEYKESFNLPVIFPPEKAKNVLAEWLSAKGIPQYHCAETEKYAHVTFFFNGGVEKQFDGEDRKLVPSPRVATYDLKPEMSVQGVADEVAATVKSKRYPFVMCNLAPPDMVGHTGVYEATIKACEATVKNACQETCYVPPSEADMATQRTCLPQMVASSTKHTTMRGKS